MIARRLLAFGFASILVSTGCAKGDAELRRDDRAKIEPIAAEDLRASKAMAEADGAARRGDVPAALDALDSRAQPAIEAGLRVATAANPKTDWGRARRDTFAKILEDRRAELGPYREALKNSDPEKLLAAIESQAKIERRAIAAIAASADSADGR